MPLEVGVQFVFIWVPTIWLAMCITYTSQRYRAMQIKRSQCMWKYLEKENISGVCHSTLSTTFSGFHLRNTHHCSCSTRHWCSLRGRDLISIGKFCLLIFAAEVGANFILGDKGTYICSSSLNRFLCLSEGATCLWGIIYVSPGCGLWEWSLLVETNELCLGGK